MNKKGEYLSPRRQPATEPSNEEVWSQFERMFSGFARMNSNRREKDGKEYFYYDGEPRQLVQICTRLATIIHDNAISAVCFTDRSARPGYLGLKAAWNKIYSGEPEPKMYFLNPTGFIDSIAGKKKYDSERTVEEEIVRHAGRRDNAMDPDLHPRHLSEIDREVQSVFAEYIETPKPILIFDTCIHDGGTIRPVKKIFARLGMNTLFCVVTNIDNESKIKPDFVLVPRRPVGGCYPFEHDFLTQRSFGSIFSSPSEDAEQKESSRRIRHELRAIFDEAPDEWFTTTIRPNLETEDGAHYTISW